MTLPHLHLAHEHAWMLQTMLVVAAMVEYLVCAIDIWRTDVLDAVMEVDGNCNVKQANKDACTIFGYPAAGMKTLNLSRLFQLAGDKKVCPCHVTDCQFGLQFTCTVTLWQTKAMCKLACFERKQVL